MRTREGEIQEILGFLSRRKMTGVLRAPFILAAPAAVSEPSPWQSYSIHLDTMKIAFFGSDTFSVHAWKALAGRLNGSIMAMNIHTPRGDFDKFLYEMSAPRVAWDDFAASEDRFDYGVVASFGKFIPRRVIDRFDQILLNVHPSLLPKYRGPAPIQRSLIDNADMGVSIINVHPTRIDAGDIYQQRACNLTLRTFHEACRLLASMGGEMAIDVILNRRSMMPQDENAASYAPKITHQDAMVDVYTMRAEQVMRLYHAIGHQELLFTKGLRRDLLLRELAESDRTDLAPGQFAYEQRAIHMGCAEGTSIRLFSATLCNKSHILTGGALYSAIKN